MLGVEWVEGGCEGYESMCEECVSGEGEAGSEDVRDVEHELNRS